MTHADIPHSPAGLHLIENTFRTGGFGRGIGSTLGLAGVSAGAGMVVLEGHPTADHQNPLGSVHGGYLATLLDGAMALALQTCLDPGMPYATADLHINFLSAIQTNAGTVRAEGRVISLGRSRALAEARLLDHEGKLCAFATGSFSIKREVSERRT